MTDEERLKGFGQEFDLLMQRYGVSIGIELVPETLGPVVQVRAVSKFVLLPNWQPPPPSSSEPTPDAPKEPDFVRELETIHPNWNGS